MRARIKNKFFILVFSAICVICSVVFFSGIAVKGVNAQIASEVQGEIKNEYTFGDCLTIPDCFFTNGDKRVKARAALQFPDGQECFDSEVTLNRGGIYLLRYIADIDGVIYTKEYKFTVYGKPFSYNSDKTSVLYGLCTDLGANSNGLLLKIASGDEVSFEHVFDMTKLDLSTKLLEGFVVPSVAGTADFTQMSFTFTDVEDSSVRLTYHGNLHDDSNAYGLTFFTAAGNEQTHCGLEYAGRLHVGTNLGCSVPHSFMAKDTGLFWGAQPPKDVAPDFRKFSIAYDYNRNQAWAGGKIISDLDDSYYYSKLWFGFPSGKARLTVSAANYNSATANICITSLFGVDLSAENAVDENCPTITVNCEYQTMPTAVVGKKYPVPQATASDEEDGKIDVKTSVWFDYPSENRKSISIENGRFAVNSVGVYAIVYQATDYSGNIGKEVLWVRAKRLQPKLTITLPDDYSTEVSVGKWVDLPDVTAEGGSGDKIIEFEVVKDGKTAEIFGNMFKIEETGKWQLKCRVIDYVGNIAVEQIEINGKTDGKPIIEDEPLLPCAYLAMATYRLPKAYAYDYSSGKKVESLCSVRVECDNTVKEYNSGDYFIPLNAWEDKVVKVIYCLNGADLYFSEIPVISPIKSERIPGKQERYRDIIATEKYFYTTSNVEFENGVLNGDVSGMTITAKGDCESIKTTFINPQLANIFSVDFVSMPGKSDFSKLAVRLRDIENPEVSITATFVKDDGKTRLIAGETSMSLEFDLEGFTPTSFGIGYNNGSLVVNGSSFAITRADNGDKFEGFPSGKVYFDIEAYDIKAGAQLFIHKICGVNVDNKFDNSAPVVDESLNTRREVAVKDGLYKINAVVAGDLLCPEVKSTLTVLSPDGDVVTSTDGIVLNEVDATREYTIKTDKYGSYAVTVKVTEEGYWKFSNTGVYESLINVTDTIRPTITFKKSFKNQIKLGEVLEIPKYELWDNCSAIDKLTVITVITNPKGLPVYLYGNERKLNCKYTGEYIVTMYVYDEAGNLAIHKTSVKVV